MRLLSLGLLVLLLSAGSLCACGDPADPSVVAPATPLATASTERVVIPDGAVPWSARRSFEVWHAPPPKPRPTSRPCGASDLRVRDIQGDGAGGQTFLFASIVKRTAGRCTTSGYPSLTGYDESGSRVTIPTSRDASSEEYAEIPATLDTGEVARLRITSDSRNCVAAQGQAPIPTQRWKALAVVLSDGSQLELGRGASTVCGISVSRFSRDNAPYEQSVRWDMLSAELMLPGRVKAGEQLTYVVTLHNGGTTDVDLAPCGGFSQTLAFQDMNTNDIAKPVFERYRLNCDSDPSLPAGASRAYVMLLDVPADAPAMLEARLTWQLVDTSPDYDAQAFIEMFR